MKKINESISLYKALFYYFLSKENKLSTLGIYLKKATVRGGTFWGWYLYTLFLNLDYWNNAGDSYALTIATNQIIFLPIGVVYGLLRELYFDYESIPR